MQSHEDPLKKTYFIKEDKIKIVYHLEEGYIIPSYLEFKKPTAEQKGSFLELGNFFEVNPFRPPKKRQESFGLLIQLTRSEQALMSAIKASDREMKEILGSRKAEEKDVSLAISVYDTIRNNNVSVLMCL